ncbi:uncharacterized protein [Marmota flaviventris]|uniref:uncharacterized protein n=1 Tax=Marmota flaviventris TaxID=93162 RepID=UPI003A8639E0
MGALCPSWPSPAWSQGCGAERLHTAPPSLPLPLFPSPLPPPGPREERENWGAGSLSTAWPRPPSRLFLGPLREPLCWLLLLAPWVRTAPALRSAQLCSAPLHSASTTPLSELRPQPAERARGAATPAPGSGCLLLRARHLAPCDPTVSQVLALFCAPALALSRCLSVGLAVFPPPHPPFPSSLSRLLVPSLALRRGEAASQENPRNLCKKLTMKFKKFFDFGAIFEWNERGKILFHPNFHHPSLCISALYSSSAGREGIESHTLHSACRSWKSNCEVIKRESAAQTSWRTLSTPSGSLQRAPAGSRNTTSTLLAGIWTWKTPVSRKYNHLSKAVTYMHF